MTDQSKILSFLKTKSNGLGFIDKIKVIYRPLICPFDILLSYVSSNQSVFDIGCGSGQFCSLIAKFTNATTITGIEISKKLIENAISINQEFSDSKVMCFEAYDGVSIPIEIKNYSIIYLIDVLHHVPRTKQIDFLNEVYSKMAIGSTLILKDIDAASVFVIFNKIHDLIFSREIGNELSFENSKKAIEKIGFKVKEMFRKRMFVYPHYFLILEK